MQQLTLQFNGYAQVQQPVDAAAAKQRTVLSGVERTAENLKSWLNSRSSRVSALAGEQFTHGEVLKAAAYGLAFLLLLGVAGWLEGGGA